MVKEIHQKSRHGEDNEFNCTSDQPPEDDQDQHAQGEVEESQSWPSEL